MFSRCLKILFLSSRVCPVHLSLSWRAVPQIGYPILHTLWFYQTEQITCFVVYILFIQPSLSFVSSVTASQSWVTFTLWFTPSFHLASHSIHRICTVGWLLLFHACMHACWASFKSRHHSTFPFWQLKMSSLRVWFSNKLCTYPMLGESRKVFPKLFKRMSYGTVDKSLTFVWKCGIICYILILFIVKGLIESQSILNWKGSIRTIESNSFLHVELPKTFLTKSRSSLFARGIFPVIEHLILFSIALLSY